MLETLEARITPSSGFFGGGIRVDTDGASNIVKIAATANFYDLADFGDPEIVSPSELHFRDADGDGVIVKFDRDVLTAESLANAFHFEEGERGSYLAGIDTAALAGNAKSLKGLDITVSVVTASIKLGGNTKLSDLNLSDEERARFESLMGGNDRAEIGFIDASGIDLGDVSIDGNLGRIVAGDAKAGTAGLESLTVESLGALGNPALAIAEDVTSVITGALRKLEVRTDIVAALVKIQGGGRAGLTEGHVGGDVIGGAFAHSGAIEAEGSVKSLTIAGDLVGGSAEHAGSIFAGKQIKQLAIGGDIRGGSGLQTGRVEAEDIGELSIAGDVRFGSGVYSASVEAGRNIKSLHVEGSLEGGAARGTGSIVAGKNIGKAEVQGNIDGGGGDYSGALSAERKMGSISVGGDLLGSGGERSGSVTTFDGRIVKQVHGGDRYSGPGKDSGQFNSFLNEYSYEGGLGGFENSGYQTIDGNLQEYRSPNFPGSETAELSYTFVAKGFFGEDYLQGVQSVLESVDYFFHDEPHSSMEIFIMGPGRSLTVADLNTGDFFLPDSLIFADAADGKIFVTSKTTA